MKSEAPSFEDPGLVFTAQPGGFTLTHRGRLPWGWLVCGLLFLAVGWYVTPIFLGLVWWYPAAFRHEPSMSLRLTPERLALRSGWGRAERAWALSEVGPLLYSDRLQAQIGGQDRLLTPPLTPRDAAWLLDHLASLGLSVAAVDEGPALTPQAGGRPVVIGLPASSPRSSGSRSLSALVASLDTSSLRVADGTLTLQRGRSEPRRWPIEAVSAVFVQGGVVKIRVEHELHVLSTPLTGPQAKRVAERLRAAIEGRAERGPEPALAAGEHDRLVVARNIPWVVVPAALFVVFGLPMVWVLVELHGPPLLLLAVPLFGFAGYLLLFSPELRPRTELRLTRGQLTVRSGWLFITERVWELADITALRCDGPEVLLVVRGRTQNISGLTPEAATWLAARVQAEQETR